MRDDSGGESPTVAPEDSQTGESAGQTKRDEKGKSHESPHHCSLRRAVSPYRAGAHHGDISRGVVTAFSKHNSKLPLCGNWQTTTPLTPAPGDGAKV